jgi:hypothetical protein
MRSRRDVLRGFSAGMAATVVPAVVVAKTKSADDAWKHAANLAEAMKTEHGGVWRISIDKDFVLVAKQLVSPSLAKL